MKTAEKITKGQLKENANFHPLGFISKLCLKTYMREKTMRKYAIWCAKKVLCHTNELLIIAERYSRGEASKEELAKANDIAFDQVEKSDFSDSSIILFALTCQNPKCWTKLV
jgi:hypothetical protein